MRSSNGLPHVAIVGAGFSGTITAVHLLARGVRVTLIDRSGRFAEGLAYGTAEPIHLLNVRACAMSAFPDQPDHFALWLESRGVGTATSFAPRQVYRAYLHEILDKAGERLARVTGDVVTIDAGVGFASGGRLSADAVVVAAGNLPPEPIRSLAATSLPVVHDPWSADGRAALATLAGQGGDILVMGTGLTMVDTVLSLDALGFAGRTIALSRRGLVPRAHAHTAAIAAVSGTPEQRGPRDLVPWVRRRARTADWREVVDSLRPLTAAIWQGWTRGEQARFLRHLRPWWDVHRHRIAPEIARKLDALVVGGRLVTRAGRIVEVNDEAVHVRWRGHAGSERLTVAGIVNCTGPQGDLRRSGDALIRHLLSRGLATTDAQGLGLDVDADLRVIPGRGDTTLPLYAIGPMTRGTFWETVAVPDIGGQAQRLAGVIAEDLERGVEPAAIRMGAA